MDGAIPRLYFESNSSVPAADLAVHILDYLYKKLDEVCLVRGGEVVTSSMLHYYCFVVLLVYAIQFEFLLISGGKL